LLAFSRKQPLRPQRMNLNDLVVETSALLRRTLGANIEINSALADDLWPTNSDRAQVEAALVNLCINSRDALPDGGRLLIETRNVTLTNDYTAFNPEAVAGDHVMLSVTDTGTGMAPDVLARAFEPFFTTKGTGKGTGLGLSMIYGFVKQSRGHITIDSKIGHGTTVKLYLPRGEPGAIEETMLPDTNLARGSERILVVEDEEQVRSIVATQLASLGYTVTEVPNGTDGLASLRAGPAYDLLLTDVIMPGNINGKALADEAAKLHPDLPVLFMSGYSQDAISNLGILDPDIALLTKPFRKIDLAQAVRRTLDTARASTTSPQ
jgi:CheY-like chemotaxis protein